MMTWHMRKAANVENKTAVKWNPVNTDIKETGHSVRIIRVSVLSGLLEKMSGTHILRPKQAVLRGNVV